MHGSTGNQHPPPLVPRSVHSRTLGHSQGRHAVQDLAAHSGFHPLTLQRSGPDHRTDDGLVPTHRGVGQTSLAVAGPGVPRALSEARSRSDVAIALSGARGLRTELRVLRRWYEHPWRAALTVALYRSVDSLGVVGRVCRDPCQRALDLLEHRGYTSRIASLAASQITGGDITSIRIDDKVELAPSAVLGRLAHVPAMNLDAGTIHEDVNRSVMAGPVERDLAESLGTSREGCLVRNLQWQSVYLYQRLQAALGLSPREMKHHAKRQRGLDCQVRVLALSTSFPAWWGGPLTDGFVGEPEGQRAAGDQSLIIGRPVRDLVSLLDVLGLAPLETAHRGSGIWGST